MNLESYLERISYQGELTPTLDTLQALHRAHILAVPFENLDIHLNRPIDLDEALIYDKIVKERRGGFCYEQNVLFAWVLRQIGFTAHYLEARVHTGHGAFGIAYDHMALMVQLEERWLADVGFGDSFLEPLPMDTHEISTQSVGVFRVIHDGVRGEMRRRDVRGEWQDEYQIYLESRNLADFQSGLIYHQTSPESHFTQKRVISQANPNGRVTLSDNTLIVTKNGTREEQPIADNAAFIEALRAYFGIEFPE